jgi:hypothetical protein
MKDKTYICGDSANIVLPKVITDLGGSIILPQDFHVNEGAGTWLRSVGDSEVAWFRMGTKNWLEISINPNNRPAFCVSVIQSTEKELAKHIQTVCKGWYVRRMNIKGVKYTLPTPNEICGEIV